MVCGTHAASIAVDTQSQGKDKPTFVPYLPEGDAVVVINTRHVELTRRKWSEKKYRWHTGYAYLSCLHIPVPNTSTARYPGGLKERSAKDQHARDPTSVLQHAVYGMLPKSRLRKHYSRRLRLFPDAEHDFEGHPSLIPWEPRPRFRHNWPRVSRIETPDWDGQEWVPINPEAFEKNLWRPAWQFIRRQEEVDELVIRRQLYKQWAQEHGEYVM